MEKEHQIIALCKTDLKYFETIYDWFLNDVYNYAYSLTNNKHQTEDACSQAFLQALENIQKFELREMSIKNWLFTITRNYIYRNSRKQNKAISINDTNESDFVEDDSFLDQIIKEHDVKSLKDSLSELNQLEKEIIHLKLWDEMKFDEIAKLMNYSVSKVKMLYYRSLQKIKNAIISALSNNSNLI